MDAARANRSFVVDPPSRARDAIRYASTALVVAATVAGVAILWGSRRQTDDAALVSAAVMVDLQPAETPGRTGDAGLDDQSQQASSASSGQVAAPTAKAPDRPEPDQPDVPADKAMDPLPPAPDPAAVLEKQALPEPKPVASPSQQARQALVLDGAQVKTHDDSDAAEEVVPRAAPRVLLAWQRAMVGRLTAARRLFAHTSHAGGIAKVRFSIDHKGRLVTEAIAQSSGDPAVDKAALDLVRRAEPFPPPPAGARDADMSFVVPIRFRRT